MTGWEVVLLPGVEDVGTVEEAVPPPELVVPLLMGFAIPYVIPNPILFKSISNIRYLF